MAKEITAVSMLDILPPNLLRDEKIKTAAEAIDKELQKTADNMKWCVSPACAGVIPSSSSSISQM